MARGKPAPDQIDHANGMLETMTDYHAKDGLDVRNYGVLDGLPEMKEIFSDLLDIPAKNIIVGGNASLNLMFDQMMRLVVFGTEGEKPWGQLEKVKFLCPAPGYDRHFMVTETLGFELITVDMTPEGPDMDQVEKLVAEDGSIKGIWCVPKYSNPQGITYSDETVHRFAKLNPAAEDLRIFWDNAYGIHHLYEDKQDYLIEILMECKKEGHPNMVYKFGSTSKISFPGSGIAAIAASDENLAEIRKMMSVQTIGHDKLNQLRHARFFGDIHGMVQHMKKHADILRPKFDTVLSVLESELGGLEIGSWMAPRGGYFISFDALDGCAKAIVAKAKEAGLILTKAGATFPYGKDPKDSNIRIAPSFPTPEELEVAAQVFVLSVKLVSIDKILGEKVEVEEA